MSKQDKITHHNRPHYIALAVYSVVLACIGCGNGNDASSDDGTVSQLEDSGIIASYEDGVDAAIRAETSLSADRSVEASTPRAGSTDAGLDRLDIHFDYRYDSRHAFQDPQRRALMEAAAYGWTRYILNDFENVPAGTPLRTRNPEHIDQPGVVFMLEYDIDDVTIMAGYASIDGPEGILGWSSLSITTRDMDVAFGNRLRERFEGLVFQPWIAHISIDEVENWFYDPTPDTDGDIPKNKVDFLGTATHEVGHVLGFATSNAFRALVSDETFIGPRAMEVYGGPIPLEPDLNHILHDTEIHGEIPVMECGSSTGRRKLPTALDLAILEDIGYVVDWSAFEQR